MGDDLLAGLNEAQRAAVTAGDGPLLLIAGPGSGKTRVLTHRIAYLVRERGVRPQAICAVTFTNKAAREMKERLEHLIGDQVRELTVGTFHALCARILRQYGNEIGLARSFTIYDDDDQLSVVKSALKDLDLDPKQVAPRSMLAGISAAKSNGLSPADFSRQVDNYRDELVLRVYRRYQETLERNEALDFDDLLLRALDLLGLPNGRAAARLQERYQHVLVDEYQDTNLVQFELVRRLAAPQNNLCVVGDEDQSVYGWRGATIKNILEFEQVYPQAQVIKLEQNYRSTKQILQAANAVIAGNSQRKDKRLWTENGDGERVIVKELADERHEAQFVVQEIERLIDRLGYTPGDFAVLYRTNGQSRALEEAFVRYGVLYQIIGGTRFYERREIKDVMALLRLILNPQDDVSLRRVVEAMPVGRGLGSKTWARLEAWGQAAGMSAAGALGAWATPGADPVPPLSGSAAGAARALMGLLADLRSRIGIDDLPTLYDRALEASGYARLLQDGTEPERWENVRELRARLAEYVSLPLHMQLLTFLEEAALVADVDALAEGASAVTLITLHAAKGLEFPVVFIVGLEDGLLPHVRSLDSPDSLEEECRLAYVGITRARQRLYLTHVYQRSNYAGQAQTATRSPFLDAIEAGMGMVPPGWRRSAASGAAPGRAGTGGRFNGAGAGRPPSTARPAFSEWSQEPDHVSGQAVRRSTPQSTRRGEWSQEVDQVGDGVIAAVAVGERVRHPVFGVGVVRAITPTRSDIEVIVVFDDDTVGTKKLMASFARLERA